MDVERAVIVGAGGAIGGAIYQHLMSSSSSVIGISSREGCDFTTDYSEDSLEEIAGQIEPGIDLLMICNGYLHDQRVRPEKRLRQVSASSLDVYLQRNFVVPALALKVFERHVHRKRRAVVAVLTARVGSIADNAKGGWYGYRCAKAAMNQFVRNTAIELSRMNQEVIVTAMHPGTTISPLSAPFVPAEEKRQADNLPWMQPQETADRLLEVIGNLTTDDNGTLVDWRGERIPW